VLLATIGVLLVNGCAKRLAPAADEPPPPPAEGPHVIEHRVATGETLALIADNYYGDPTRAEQIARDNGLTDSRHVAAGSTLMLRFDADGWSAAQRRAAALEFYNRGVEALAGEDLAAAESQFAQALRIAPELVSARYNLAVVRGRRGRNEEAAAILAELHEQRPGDTDIAFALGHALFQQGEFSRAAGVFADLLAEDPGHRRAAFGLARCLQEGGNQGAAAAAWRRYLELDATSSWADQARRYLRELGDG
jgi:tetratricopeptide (TPR) repeat protein